MRGENRWYIDLAIVGGLTGFILFVIVIGVGGWFRAGFAVLLVTLLPGYALVALLFPAGEGKASRAFDENKRGLRNSLSGKTGIDPVERFVLSVSSSLVLVSVIALVANFTPWGITLIPILFGTAGLTLILALSALGRRARLPPRRRYAPNFSRLVSNVRYSVPRSGFSVDDTWTRRFNVALVASLLLFAGTVGFAAMNPPQSDGFTEFYVETGNVTAETQSMYPSQFGAGETRELPVAVTNQEHERTEYTLFVLLQQIDGDDADATVREERQLGTESFALEPDATRNLSLSITPRTTGTDLRLVLLLYEGEPPTDPSIDTAYRVLRLPIDVEDGSGVVSESSTDPSPGLDASERTSNRLTVT